MGATDVNNNNCSYTSVLPHRQTELEGKLIEALEHIWVIIHLDGSLIQASFEGLHVMGAQNSQPCVTTKSCC